MTIKALKTYLSSIGVKKASDLTVEKQAFSLADVKNMLSNANNWYKSQSPETRALIGAGIGLGGGALLGGSRKSALLGALAGAGTGAYWNDVRRAIDSVNPVARDAGYKTKEYLKALLGVNKPQESAQASPRDTATAKANAAAGV